MKNNQTITGAWKHPAVIARNNFIHKSLSCWSLNVAVGCTHGCRFCYVPEASTNKLAPQLQALGVTDPDEQWGSYAFLREWDEKKFLRSLDAAECTPKATLNPDGNRAVMLCTTTDPYLVFPCPQDNEARRQMVRRMLTLIRDHSTLNVRILTRGGLARTDFDVMASLGKRLMFGMSLPTLNAQLARIYEPLAPAPAVRLRTLAAAKQAGLNVFVAMAPTYPECDEDDLRQTLLTIKSLDPLTVFHEPINIRAENVQRIQTHAKSLGVKLRDETWTDRDSWAAYALNQLALVEYLAGKLKVDGLHLWPDDGLKSYKRSGSGPAWLDRWWNRISEWP